MRYGHNNPCRGVAFELRSKKKEKQFQCYVKACEKLDISSLAIHLSMDIYILN